MTTPGKYAFSSFLAVWLIATGGLVALIPGCTPAVENRGYLPATEALAQIQPGMQTREGVLAVLGTPSSLAAFGKDMWYYISSREQNFAFYRPEELERKVIAVLFDDAGIVKDVKVYGLEDGQSLMPVTRVTPTAGSEMSLLQQLIGNIGRFHEQRNRGGTE